MATGKGMVSKQEEEIKAKLANEKNKDKAVVDVVFMCDCTGSMGVYMKKAKDTAHQILSDMKATYTESSVFFSFIGYRDHCDPNLIDFLDLTGDVEEVTKFIDKLTANGGGDEAEAVVDALFYAQSKVSWRPEAMRQLVHILDAPPHGKEFGGGDNHPGGCPCGHDYKKILQELEKMGTEYMVLNFTQRVDTMVKIYTKYHPRIECVPLVIVPPTVSMPKLSYPAMPYTGAALHTGTEKRRMAVMPPSSKAKKAKVAIGAMFEGATHAVAKRAMAPPAALGSKAMDITSQVSMQMAKNISQSVVSNMMRFQKKQQH